MIARPTPKHPPRRGAAAFELLFVTPLILFMLLGMVGVADMLIAEQMLNEAAGRAARALAIGVPEDQIKKDVIPAILGPDRTEKANIVFVTKDKDGHPIPPGGLIEVRIELEVKHATATLLAPVSSDELLIGRTVMQRE